MGETIEGSGMTTIAYRDGVLVVDGQVTRQTTIIELNGKKSHRADDGSILMISGDLMQFQPFIDWYEKRSDVRPSLVSSDGSQSMIVVLRRDGLWEHDHDGFAICLAPFAAWGSGNDIALIAMYMGASAREAVELAAKFDIYTGGEITEMRLEP